MHSALSALHYGIEYGHRILVVDAGPGLGKTTLLRQFERGIHTRDRCLLISPCRGSGPEALRKLLVRIDGSSASDDLLSWQVRIDHRLGQLAERSRSFVLLLDYERDHEECVLDTLRLLTNLESLQRGWLRVVIAGSPELAKRLEDSGLPDDIVTLSPLTTAEVAEYIDHRLRRAGWKGGRPLFTAKACELVAEKSRGKPASINHICSDVLQKFTGQKGGCCGYPGRLQADPDNNIIDAEYIDSVLSQQKPRISTSLDSAGRRIRALLGILVALVLLIAGLWYKGAIEQSAAKHLRPQTILALLCSELSAGCRAK
ncbi:MAG TPA: AAA family ATPase [Candidatus Binataceae bacterium]|nr:AAA family ATPase [Candidatus Binataceae bacterium]